MTRRRQTQRRTLLAVTVASLVAAIAPISTANAANPVDVVFNSTGAEQQWTVPAGVSSIHVVVIGAKGAGGGGYPGGLGQNVTGDLAVAPGLLLYVEVGANGSARNGGFNGGGSAGSSADGVAGGGGGASDIRTVSRATAGTLNSRLIVAGGGGGVGHQTQGGNAGAQGAGGSLGGQPGTASSGGGGGAGDQPGLAGGLGGGGGGGSWCAVDVCGSGTAGGGGGGGYFGGGGGAGVNADLGLVPSGAGGGGSAYTGDVSNASVSVETELNASIKITYTATEVPTTSAELFISEYVDASSPNQAIEIYNGTGAAIDLGSVGYQIEIFANGSPTPTSTVPLVGNLAHGDVFVVVRDSSADLFGYADQLASGLNFTGNDAVALRRSPGGALLDIFGQIGVDPGVVGWGSGELITNDRTLVREPSITAGRTVNGPFDPADEWNVFPFGSYDFLGSHTIDAGGGDPPDPTPGPTSGPGSGTVDATISMTTSVCIELSTSSVDFGSGRFGQVGVAGTPEIVVTNCGPDSITLFARGTDASAAGAAWNLVKNTATCADTLGTDNFHLHLHENQTPDVDWDLGTSNTELEDVASGSIAPLGPSIDTACPGSSGAGQVMSMQIVFTATEAQP